MVVGYHHFWNHSYIYIYTHILPQCETWSLQNLFPVWSLFWGFFSWLQWNPSFAQLLRCFFFGSKVQVKPILKHSNRPPEKNKKHPGKMNGWNLNITPLEIRNIIWSKPPLFFSSWWFGWTTHLTNRIVKLDPSSLGFGKIKKEKPPPRYYMILSSPCRDPYGLL